MSKAIDELHEAMSDYREWRNYSNLWSGNREVCVEHRQYCPHAIYWYRLLSTLNPSEGEGG